MKKLFVPHGHFKRRFTHKRKRWLGLRTQVYDAVQGEWVYTNRLEFDKALLHVVENMSTSSERHPSPRVSMSFVTHGQEAWEIEAQKRSEQLREDQRAYVESQNESFEKAPKGEPVEPVEPVEHETLDRTRSHAVAHEPAQFGGFESPCSDSSESSVETPVRSSYEPSFSSGGIGSGFGSSSSDSGSSFSSCD
jgi:hypothetical protein